MTEEQAKELKTLITDMKEKQLKAFSANASVVTYNAWIYATQAVDAYIDSITVVSAPHNPL